MNRYTFILQLLARVLPFIFKKKEPTVVVEERVVVEEKIVVQEQIVVVTQLSPEFLDRISRDFPVKMYKTGVDLADLAQSAGEQRVVEYLRREAARGQRLV